MKRREWAAEEVDNLMDYLINETQDFEKMIDEDVTRGMVTFMLGGIYADLARIKDVLDNNQGV